VSIAHNGKEALAALAADKFDLVLMDVQMPEMDGLEATVAIRTREKRTGGHIPIIAMTAHALKGDRQRCLDAGMDAYIAKPIHVEQFLETIAGVCGGTSAADRANAPADEKPDPPVERKPAAAGGLDWDAALKALKGDRGLLDLVVQAVLDESADTLRAIRDAVSGGNAAALRLAAHKLKGSIRHFGASRVFDLAFQLERMGEHNDLAAAQDVLAGLEAEWSALAEALAARRRAENAPSIP
jgi:CheY-like chemotaxis protein